MNEPNPFLPPTPRRITAAVEGRRVRLIANLAESVSVEEARLLQDELSAAILTALLRQTLNDDRDHS